LGSGEWLDCWSASGSSAPVSIFTSLRPESFVVPTEADGGSELWSEVLRRGLFDANLAGKANTSLGETFVWPPLEGDR